jgi:DNA polymerase (family 10)
VLKGIESDILPDGSLDYDDDVLERMDFVVASVHGHFGLKPEDQTKRCIRAVQNPFTSILGHPTGRLLLARDGFEMDLEAVIEAAVEVDCALELNANPQRLDLDWRELRHAAKLGARISIGPDAHRTEGLQDVRYGVAVARKGWLRAENVLNALPLDELRAWLRARRP